MQANGRFRQRCLGLVAIIGALGLTIVGAARSAAPSDNTDAQLGPTVRRLSEAQYRQSVADIFGPDIKVAGRFEPDTRVDLMLAVGSSSIGMSPAGMEQYDAMARSIAEQALAENRRQALLQCAPRDPAGFDKRCARSFFASVGQRLYRRDLSNDELKVLVAAAGQAAKSSGNFYAGLRYTLGGMLISPNFLYRVDRTVPDGHGGIKLDAYSMASRISFFLTNSTPDAELLAAAKRGDLDTPAGLEHQVDRLLAAPTLERAVRAFFWDMLQFDKFAAMAKDPEIYPAYNPSVASLAEEQTLRNVADLLVTRNGDYRDIFTTRNTWMTRPLGLLYGVPVRARKGWEQFTFPEAMDRSGILTDLSFLMLHSHPGRSSPTIRGKAVREVFLCQQIPPPPPNVDFTVVQDTHNPTMKTARERLTAHRTKPVCSGCHKLMDPIGLSLERFDGAGIFRATENDAPIDMRGSLDKVDYDSASGLGRALHDSPRASQCLVNNLYRYGVGRNVALAEKPDVTTLTQQFASDGYRVPALMRRIALSPAFYRVSPPSLPSAPARIAQINHADRSRSLQ